MMENVEEKRKRLYEMLIDKQIKQLSGDMSPEQDTLNRRQMDNNLFSDLGQTISEGGAGMAQLGGVRPTHLQRQRPVTPPARGGSVGGQLDPRVLDYLKPQKTGEMTEYQKAMLNQRQKEFEHRKRQPSFAAQLGMALQAPKLTESQSKRAVFFGPANIANSQLRAIEDRMFAEGKGLTDYIKERAADSEVGRAVGTFFGVLDEDDLQYNSYAQNFTNSVLRDESGAVITDPEMQRRVRMTFPRTGDTPKIIKAKQEIRQALVDAMALGSGQGAMLLGWDPGGRISSVDPRLQRYFDLLEGKASTRSAMPRLERPERRIWVRIKGSVLGISESQYQAIPDKSEVEILSDSEVEALKSKMK